MVAGLDEQDAVPQVLAFGGLALFVAALGIFLTLTGWTSLLGLVPLEKPPDYLRERAREILVLAGHGARPADSLFAFEPNHDYLRELQERVSTGSATWEELRASPPSGLRFWYRQSPQELEQVAVSSLGNALGDPPDTVPGMARVGLDTDGRLVALAIVPGERVPASPDEAEPDWEPLLRATGIDPTTLATASPEWAPPAFADRRAAWTASWPGQPQRPVRIEAAAVGGRPISLQLVEPWTRAAEEEAPPRGFWQRAVRLVQPVNFVVVLLAAALVALRNVRRGRGDRRGALRFALYLGSARMLWLLGAHHVASPEEVDVLLGHLSYAMQRVGLAYIFYLAIEPYARRLWPRMLVSWVRVLDGRLRDPLVGRDLLLGAAAGVLLALVDRLKTWLPHALGGPSPMPRYDLWTGEALRGTLQAFVAVVGIHTQTLLEIIFPITLLVIFRLLLRRTVPAVVLVSLLGTLLAIPASGGSAAGHLVGFGVQLAVAWSVLFRFGLLAFATMFCISQLVDLLPLTLAPSGWYVPAVLLALGFIAAPALWGFWMSQAGRPLFRDELLEPAARL
jgi:serine/threonine-protein kinase